MISVRTTKYLCNLKGIPFWFHIDQTLHFEKYKYERQLMTFQVHECQWFRLELLSR